MVTRTVSRSTLDVEDVLSKLTWLEKISLLTGRDFWHTNPVHRLGVPAIRVSDGPNGVRGTTFVNGVPAACFPCGTGLAATWDTELIKSGGALMGKEAIAKGASCILGPTSNMQRSPLGGRGFESYSEDPVLAGAMATAVVVGIQSTGVSATVKHFVCNDQEHERQVVSAVVTERALREIYLMPFQLTERDARPDAYMTSYAALNGVHCSEDSRLLKGILRGEWGFDGIVMSDWQGTYSATESIMAGLDLEMPGPSRVRGDAVTVALNSGKLQAWDVDARVRSMLKFIKKAQKLGIPEDAPEKSIDSPETSRALRTIGASGQVLLKNDGDILPLKKGKRTAVIGPNAKIAAYSGGGSATLLPYYAITPFDGIKAQAKDVQYAIGATGYKYLPLLSEITETPSGKQGLSVKAYDKPVSDSKRKLLAEATSTKSDLLLEDYMIDKIPGHLFYLDLEGTLTLEESADYDFGVAVAGTAKLYVNGKLVVDNATKQTAGDTFFSMGTVEERGSIHLKGGKQHAVRIEYGSAPTAVLEKIGGSMLQRGGLRIGGVQRVDSKREIEKAVELAKQVDQVIIVAGLSSEWESEGFDRPDMTIPGHSNELIAAVASANPTTVVVLQSGCPVEMPWADQVPAILQSWYGGNETGNAIADVLFGSVNPSGKLPLSFPKRVEDNPAFLNYRSDRGRVLYGEDVFIGYRFYEATRREVLFPFGHGLSYTSFEISHLNVEDSDGTTVTVTVQVANTGARDGAEVVQVYVAQKHPSVSRPKKELKGFAKVHLKAGERKAIQVHVSKKYAASWYDEKRDAWIMEKDEYAVLVGTSSASTPLVGGFVVEATSWWKGL